MTPDDNITYMLIPPVFINQSIFYFLFIHLFIFKQVQ